MPIRPENRKLYPRNWRAISLHIRGTRAKWACEMPDCQAKHGEPHPITGSKVVLTVAHLNHDPRDNRPENLMAMCQKCHNTYDAAHRAANRKRNAQGKNPKLLTPDTKQ